MQRSLEERTSYISRDDYEKAYALIDGAAQGKTIVAEIYDSLTRNPDDDLVLGPKFVALLALICEPGRNLASALLAPDEVLRLQRELASEFAAVRDAFPQLGARGFRG